MSDASDAWDENTPPPRQRPQGVPLPRRVVLPPGEGLIGFFAHCDQRGRVPPRCVLAEFVGTMGGVPSGHVVVALSHTGTSAHTELGAVGDPVPADRLRWYRVVAEVVQGRHVYVILAPKGGGS